MYNRTEKKVILRAGNVAKKSIKKLKPYIKCKKTKKVTSPEYRTTSNSV